MAEIWEIAPKLLFRAGRGLQPASRSDSLKQFALGGARRGDRSLKRAEARAPIRWIQRSILLLLPALLFSGCATTSTIEARRQERSAAYSSLTPEFKTLVDQRKIKVGMPMDAVYIAWGKPSQVVQGESSQGPITTWLYYGTTFEEYRYWSYRPEYRGYYWSSPYLERDYVPRNYVRAEVTFQNGLVTSWRTLPRPPY